MRTELNKIRQDFKRVLAEFTLFRERYESELKELRIKDGDWQDPGSIVMYMAERSADNLIKQIDKTLSAIPKERRGKKNATMPLRVPSPDSPRRRRVKKT